MINAPGCDLVMVEHQLSLSLSDSWFLHSWFLHSWFLHSASSWFLHARFLLRGGEHKSPTPARKKCVKARQSYFCCSLALVWVTAGIPAKSALVSACGANLPRPSLMKRIRDSSAASHGCDDAAAPAGSDAEEAGDKSNVPASPPRQVEASYICSSNPRKYRKLMKCPACCMSVDMCPEWAQESKNKKTGKRVLEAPGCLKCYELFQIGAYAKRPDVKVLTFEEFCQLCETNAKFQAEVHTAMKVRDDDEEICMVVMEGWRAEERYTCVTAKSFEKEHGMSITAAGFKLQGLPTSQGKHIEGLLVKNPGPTEYVKYTDNLLCRRVCSLPFGQALCPEQGKNVHAHQLKDKQKTACGPSFVCALSPPMM